MSITLPAAPVRTPARPLPGLRLFLRKWQNLLALLITGFFVFVALDAPRLAPYENPYWVERIQWPEDRLKKLPHPPGDQTILGTLAVSGPYHQMDVYTGLVQGTRSALRFGLLTASLTALIGVLVGAIAAFTGGLVGNAIMRVTDALLAVPVIVGVFLTSQITLFILRGPEFREILSGEWVTEPTFIMLVGHTLVELGPILAGVVLFSWMPYARLTHTMVLRVKQLEYIDAARALGAGPARLIFRHLIPNSISPAIVLMARDIGGMVLLQTTFTYLGMAGGSEWGEMLAYARNWIIGPGGDIFVRWWIFLPPTLALALFGMGWNLLGDGLNEWLNPRTKSHN